MTTLYCGMTGSNSQVMFESMDRALNNGAEGISIFTIRSLRSPEIRKKIKAYADSARASRAASKEKSGVSVPKIVNANPFENTGIMNAVNMHMLAYLSMANASILPELKNTDPATIDLVFKNALQGNTAEDYIDHLMNPQEREPGASTDCTSTGRSIHQG